MAFTLTSSAFRDGEVIPRSFTCEGADAVPPLAWSDPPAGTQSFALIVDDPDTPRGTFTHWLLYDVPASATELVDQSLGTSLENDFGRRGYNGPCPPVGHGQHRYFFTLHAVDVPRLELKSKTRKALEQALQAHSIATARLMGRYERTRRA